MLLKGLGSSLPILMTCLAVLYSATAASGGYSGETKSRVTLSASAAHYIYLRR
jgi:hypothetical protein